MKLKYSDDDQYNANLIGVIFSTVVFFILLALLPSSAHTFLFVIYAGFASFYGFFLWRSIARIDEINARYAQYDRQRAIEEEQKKLEDAKRPHVDYANNYHSTFRQLADILKKVPDDYPDQIVTALPDALAQIGINPHSEDWQKSKDVFIEKIRPYSIETLQKLARLISFRDAESGLDFFENIEKGICTFEVSKAPEKFGLLAYGLPSRDHARGHDSPTPAHYLIQPNDRFKHAYILGKTGAGKTTLLKNLITQDIMCGDGVIVLSPESGLFDFLLEGYPIYRIHDLIIYDPTDSTPPVVSLNPIHLEDSRHLAREAGAVSGTLARAMGNDLSGAMQTLLLKCAYTLLQLPDSSFQDLRALLKPVSPLRDGLPHHPALDEVTREYWRDEFDKGGHRRSAEALISRLDAFFMPPLSQTMSRASFAFSEALNASRRVFLFDYSRIHGTQQTIIGQLTLSHILQTLLKRDPQPEAERIPYHLYIDEFQTFAEQSESAFRDLLNRARKYRMSVTLAHQVTADIPPRLLDVILGNVGTKVCMQIATTDAEFFANQMHIRSYSPRDGAERLEQLKKGQAFILTPHPDVYHALKIDIPAEPMYYATDVPHPVGYPARLRDASKNRYGTRATAPPPAPPTADRPRPDKPRDEDEDDGIFT